VQAVERPDSHITENQAAFVFMDTKSCAAMDIANMFAALHPSHKTLSHSLCSNILQMLGEVSRSFA